MQIPTGVKFAVLSAGGLLMALAGVSPDDAISNLGAWADLVGVDSALLANQSADTWGFAAGGMLLVTGLAMITVELWWPPVSRIFKKIWRPKPPKAVTVALPIAEAPKVVHEYLPLTEVARSIYEDLRAFDKDHAQIMMARRSSGETAEKILDYFAITISQMADVFGKHPPSEQPEKLTQRELNRGLFINGGSAFAYYGEKTPRFVDMTVNKNDAPKVFDWLKSTNRYG